VTAIIVHGGAGLATVERHERLREGCRRAARAGHVVLAAGGSAIDAVVAAVRVLEDDPEYNAGAGSVLTRDGSVETDAAVMDGVTQRLGAVAAVPDLGNAIALARAVLDDGQHVMLAGAAAWRFAAEVGIQPPASGALVTERARRRLAEHLARTSGVRERDGGTVGAVARDGAGRFAAATSTGGVVGKRAGRVGDTPVPGAGTWADRTCAVSATGDGEAILRVALAHSIAVRVAGGNAALRAACEAVLGDLAELTGGTAGVIGVDVHGVVGIQLSETMPIAWIVEDLAGDLAGHAGDSIGERIAAVGGKGP
jgi:L-asparaginase / beta-aspartyl-peptidase